MEFMNYPKLMILVGVLSIPIYATLARLFYGDRFENLGEAIKYLLWPDWYSLLRGKVLGRLVCHNQV